MATIHELLGDLVSRYNELLGYRNRYRIVASIERSAHQSRRLALLKREGALDRNITGWLRPAEMMAYLCGGIDAIESIQRRAARGEIPTAFRIAAAGLSIGFPVPDHTEKEPAS